MHITIHEAMKLESFQRFSLVAGLRGLENRVEAVGIVDHEFDTQKEEQFYKGQFVRNQFVISSLLFAKNNPELILTALKYLVDDGVAGLAIKTIYFTELPTEAIEYANAHEFPIFLFGRDVFFENIITEIMDRIRLVGNYKYIEEKIGILTKKHIEKEVVREIALELNSLFREAHFVLYFKERVRNGNEKLLSIISRLNHSQLVNSGTSIFKYREGILVIATYETSKKSPLRTYAGLLMETLGLHRGDYFIGISSFHGTLEELNESITESIFSAMVSKAEGCELHYYSDIGSYRLLLPSATEPWAKQFCTDIVEALENYDRRYTTEMFRTALAFIENDGRIKSTAAALYIHENSLRYRITRIKEILGMEKLEGGFFEQLSLAVKLYKIQEEN